MDVHARIEALDDAFAGFDARAEESREAVAVVGSVAERELVELRPLEIQVQVVLPREADAAVNLEA